MAEQQGSESIVALYNSGSLQPGMAIDDLVQRVGPPLKKSKETEKLGPGEQYVYPDGAGWFVFIYVADGKVTAIRH